MAINVNSYLQNAADQKNKADALKQEAAMKKAERLQKEEDKATKGGDTGKLIGGSLGALIAGIVGGGNPMAIQAGWSAGGGLGQVAGKGLAGGDLDIKDLETVVGSAMSMPGGAEAVGVENAGGDAAASISQANSSTQTMGKLDKLFKSGSISKDKYEQLKSLYSK